MSGGLHTAIQPYSHTAIQSHSHTVTQPYSHTAIQSHSHTVTQSYSHTAIQSQYSHSALQCMPFVVLYICDRPRKKVTQVGKNLPPPGFFWISHLLSGFFGFRIYSAMHIFAENLVRVARCIAKIRLLLCPVYRQICTRNTC